MRGTVTSIIVMGTFLITWGLVMNLGTFTTDLSKLVRYAGGGDVVLSSALNLFQIKVLNLFGLGDPTLADQESGQIPDTGLPEPTYSAPLPAGAGLVPYEIEVDGTPRQAPPLPTAAQPDEDQVNQASPAAAPEPQQELTATPVPSAVPGWIVIPSIGLDAPVIVSHTKMVVVGKHTFAQWEAPNLRAAGWQESSALLGEPGNTVLNGHHNVYGEVFGRLYELSQGDEIIMYSGNRDFHYAVSQVMKLEERNASLKQRLENARWVLPSSDERLTLVTCWPPISNTFRLIVVAVPLK